MKRREFIALVGGAAIGAPLAARAQQAAQVRRIGVLMNLPDGDPEAKRRIDAFLKSMSALGWNDGKNIHVDYRYGVGPQIVKKNAAELVALAPDVILANAPPAVLAVQQATHTIPVVFAAVTDPVALGLVQSLARPGGNVTGFSPAELGLSAKWLELLKEIAPDVKRVAVFRAASNPASETQIAIIETAARSMGVEISLIDVSDTAAMERDVADFASAAGRRPDRDQDVGERCGARRDHRARRRVTGCRRSIRCAFSQPAAVSSPTVPTSSMSTAKPRATSTASSRAPSRPICRCSRRASSSW